MTTLSARKNRWRPECAVPAAAGARSAGEFCLFRPPGYVTNSGFPSVLKVSDEAPPAGHGRHR